MVGNVDRPEDIVYPETPIDSGDEDLVSPDGFDNLPQENLPTGFRFEPIVVIPLTRVSDFTLQVMIPMLA